MAGGTRTVRAAVIVALALGLGIGVAGCTGTQGSTAGLRAALVHLCRTAKNHCGLVQPPGGVTDSLRLDRSQVRAGRPITATLTIVNHRPSPVTLPDTSSGCRPSDAVVLANRHHGVSANFAAVCQSGHITLPPGRTAWSFRVVTTYSGCAPTATSGMPECGAHGRLPPLPPGSYVAVLVGVQLPLPVAVSAPVTLTAAG